MNVMDLYCLFAAFSVECLSIRAHWNSRRGKHTGFFNHSVASFLSLDGESESTLTLAASGSSFDQLRPSRERAVRAIARSRSWSEEDVAAQFAHDRACGFVQLVREFAVRDSGLRGEARAATTGTAASVATSTGLTCAGTSSFSNRHDSYDGESHEQSGENFHVEVRCKVSKVWRKK